MIQIFSSPESSKMMRFSRPWYFLPFWVNLAFLFSVTQIVTLLDYAANDIDDVFPLPGWLLYASIAVSSPTCLAVCRLLSDPAIPLLIGSLITSCALIWTAFETGITQMVIFSIFSGLGLSLSFQAIIIAISPYFIKDSLKTSVMTLVGSMVVMVITFPLMNYATTKMESNLILWLSPVTFVTSLIPFQIYLCSYFKTKSTGKESSHHIFIEPAYIPSTDKEAETVKSNYLGTLTIGFKKMFGHDNWTTSFVSVFVWLSWGAAIDTSWMSLGWRYQYFSSTTSLSALQLLLCFILWLVKVLPEILHTNEVQLRSNLANNYLQLGLLGVGGVLLCLIPEHSHQFHSHLLFTIGLAQQYDDLTDLYLLPRSNLSFHSRQYQLIKYKLSFVVKEGEEKCCTLWNSLCLFCHMVSLLLMSCLAMILGIQIANCLGYLTTLYPFNHFFTRGGLMSMSTAAICVSLLKPETWILQKHTLTVV